MAHYKDSSNKLHFLASADYEHLLPAGCVPITDQEAVDIRIASIVPPTVQDKIHTLEATVTQRRLREAALGTASGLEWLTEVEAQLATLRAQL
jgi:hypothetical protein